MYSHPAASTELLMLLFTHTPSFDLNSSIINHQSRCSYIPGFVGGRRNLITRNKHIRCSNVQESISVLGVKLGAGQHFNNNEFGAGSIYICSTVSCNSFQLYGARNSEHHRLVVHTVPRTHTFGLVLK